MGFPLSAQTAYFLWSLVLGAAIAVAYDLVRAVRMLLRAGRRHTMVSDVLFFAACGVITSLFALPFNKGSVRGFIIFGEAVGFLSYRLTLGTVTGRLYAALARLLRRLSQKSSQILKNFFDFLLKAGTRIVYNVGELIDRLLNIVAKFIQRHRSRKERAPKVKKHEQKKQTKRQSRRTSAVRSGHRRRGGRKHR